jgi:hypothetical protein
MREVENAGHESHRANYIRVSRKEKDKNDRIRYSGTNQREGNQLQR